jgi:hypothetical protein
VRARFVGVGIVTLALVSCASDSLPAHWSSVYDDPGVFGGPGDQQMSGLVGFDTGLIAVGHDTAGGDADAAVWASSDGTLWVRTPHDESAFGGDGDQMMGGAAVAGAGVVAVGTDTAGGDSDAAVWISPDRVSWTRIPNDDSVFGGDGDQGMWAVTAADSGLIAVGFDGSGGDTDVAVWTSPEGLTWTRVAHDESVFGGDGDQWASDVAAGAGVVAVGSDSTDGYGDAAVWTSPDGVDWTRIANQSEVFGGPGSEGMFGVVMGGPGVVAVGYAWFGMEPYRAVVWTSPDGTTWTRVPDEFSLIGTDGKATFMYSLAASDGGVVAVGIESSLGLEGDPAVWTSPDGVSWSRVADPSANLARPGPQAMAAVAVGPEGLVAVGRDGAVGYSDTDAAVWVAPRR